MADGTVPPLVAYHPSPLQQSTAARSTIACNNCLQLQGRKGQTRNHLLRISANHSLSHMSPPSLFLLACLIASASSLPLASRDRDLADYRHTMKGGKSAADAAAVATKQDWRRARPAAGENSRKSAPKLPGDDLRERVRNATDGCVNVFVDAGANIGVHTRFLFEPAKYPHSHFTKVFKRSFGSIASNGMAPLTCSLGFEPNPKHIKRHKALERAYKQMGWRYSFFPFALGVNTSEDLVFYENPRASRGAQSEYWAFSTKQLHADQSEVRVPSASFDTVLAQIGKRRLPGHADHHPRVLVKMDIEGSEFAVVPQVMMSGSLCRVVDYISVEWHARFAPLRLHSKQRLDLGTQRGATSVKSLLQAAMADGGRAAGCLTDVFEVDDESYLHDGMPLPVSL